VCGIEREIERPTFSTLLPFLKSSKAEKKSHASDSPRDKDPYEN